MFGKKGKQSPKTTPVEQEEDGTALKTGTPINGVAGGRGKAKASKKKLVWGGLAVFVVVIMIANKVMVNKHPDEGSATHQGSALPSMAGSHKSPAHHGPSALTVPPAPTTGALMAAPPTNPQPAPVSVSVQAVQNLLSAASNGTATVVQVWPGPGKLEGVIYADANQEQGVAWVDMAQHLVLIGTLIGANGKNYNDAADFGLAATPRQESAGDPAVASTASAPKSTLMRLKEGGSGFIVGTQGPLITAYIDPNSETSHRLYDSLELASDNGKVRTRYVLVALKDKGSLEKAEQILSAPSPAKVLSEDEHLGKVRANQDWAGGIKGVQGSLYMAQEVNGNTALLAAAGYIGDPVIVWCNKAGKAQVATNEGAVGDLSAIISSAGKCH